MQIEMISVSEPYKEGKYNKILMKYSREGKETERKLVDVGDSSKAFGVLRSAKAGETYEIDLVKNGEFQNWVNATKLDGSVGQQPIKAYAKDNVQTYIIRQNSVTNAVAFGGPDVETVLAIAAKFEAWVKRDDSEVFKDDIPFN